MNCSALVGDKVMQGLFHECDVEPKGQSNILTAVVTGSAPAKEIKLEFLRKVKSLQCASITQCMAGHFDPNLQKGLLIKNMVCIKVPMHNFTECCVSKELFFDEEDTNQGAANLYVAPLKLW